MRHYAIEAYGEVDVWVRVFLSSALVGVEWSASRLIPGKRDPCSRWIGGWVGPRTGLDDLEGR
jgi:hypothetical protein